MGLTDLWSNPDCVSDIMFELSKNGIGLTNDTMNIAVDIFYTPWWSCWTLFVWAFVLLTKIPLWLQILLPILLVTYAVNRVLASYQAYLDLGQGGTPADAWGWWRIQRLLFFGRIDVLDPPNVPPGLKPHRGKLFGLPVRQGERPNVIGCDPQRQIDQKASPDVFQQHIANIQTIADHYPLLLKVEKSFLEPHTTALKAIRTKKTDETSTIEEFGWEIAHPHIIDGSMHVVLHPEDIKTVIDANWGERHPIARTSWYWLKWFHRKELKDDGVSKMRPPVPEHLCFIYAPRNEEDRAIVDKIIAAGASFVTGDEKMVFPPDPNYEP